jgi:hypothetical protein
MGNIHYPSFLYEWFYISVRDRFSKDVLKSGKYNAGQIDNQWTEEIKTSFLN